MLNRQISDNLIGSILWLHTKSIELFDYRGNQKINQDKF